MRALVSAVVLMVLNAGAATGQPLGPAAEVGVGVIGRSFGGPLEEGTSALFPMKVDVDDTQLKGLWLEAARLTPRFSAQLALRRSTASIVERNAGLFAHRPILATIDIASLEVIGLYQIPIRPVVPFVGLGIGMTSLDINTGDPADQDSNRLGVSMTLGAKMYLTRRLGILCDARQRATYLGARRKSIDEGWSDRDRWFRSPEVLCGVFAAFPAW